MTWNSLYFRVLGTPLSGILLCAGTPAFDQRKAFANLAVGKQTTCQHFWGIISPRGVAKSLAHPIVAIMGAQVGAWLVTYTAQFVTLQKQRPVLWSCATMSLTSTILLRGSCTYGSWGRECHSILTSLEVSPKTLIEFNPFKSSRSHRSMTDSRLRFNALDAQT